MMKAYGSQLRETIDEAGYDLVVISGNSAVIKDRETGQVEVWQKNDHHSGYTIEIGGQGYEFVTSCRC